MSAERLERLERMIEQMVVRGKVEAVDCDAKKVRVRYGPDSVSDWIEWKPQRSGLVTIWSPPQVGEGCTIISPGDINFGEVYLGSYHSAMTAPSVSPDETVMQWPDGTVVRYNMVEHKLTVEVSGDVDVNVKQDVKVKAGGNILCDASNIKLNGGAGVVTGAHICQISGKPHADCSSTVFAGK